ncbi:unnamed protein product [Chrysodeixis includens]|uniref:Uncharacterized protein n=1 Tax=Chrysodeixis includens TaxID=689277 RepID=A0A9P0BVI4_CHRIL|nr:unnamed protein product [Chrysodeixis includens]
MYILVAFVGCLAVASAADLTVGVEGGKVIFEQNVTASPAIWRQVKNLTVNATENDVISRVVVIDNRAEKDGEAQIVEGGEGYDNVTIELKSPAVFRGFDFTIKVFGQNNDGQVQQTSQTFGNDGQVQQTPQILGNDGQVQQTPEILVNEGQSQVPMKDLNVNDETQQHEREADVIEQKPTDDQQQVQIPAVANEQIRQNRETEQKQAQVPVTVAKEVKPEETQQSIADKNYKEFKGVVSQIFDGEAKKENEKDAAIVKPAVLDKDLNQQVQKSEVSTTPKAEPKETQVDEDIQQVKGQHKLPLPYVRQ